MSAPCPGCTPNPDGTVKWSNTVAATFPFVIDGNDAVFGYRCSTCGRKWERRQDFADMMAEMGNREFRRPALPLTAATIRTMDEGMFRAIVTGSYDLILSQDALTALRERAAELGVPLSHDADGAV